MYIFFLHFFQMICKRKYSSRTKFKNNTIHLNKNIWYGVLAACPAAYVETAAFKTQRNTFLREMH